MSEESCVAFINKLRDKDAKPYVVEQKVFDELEEVIHKYDGMVSVAGTLGVLRLLEKSIIDNQE